MNQALIDILKSTRMSKGITQESVAEALGVKKNTISNYENGKSEPDIDSLIKMCKVYGLDSAQVLKQAYNDNNKKSPSAELTTEERVQLVAENLYITLVGSGIIAEGADLTEKQAEKCLRILKILFE